MPINPVTQEWYGKKATPKQRAAFDAVLDRMQNHSMNKHEADAALKAWIAQERRKIAAEIERKEKAMIEEYIMEQVQIMTAILEKEQA